MTSLRIAYDVDSEAWARCEFGAIPQHHRHDRMPGEAIEQYLQPWKREVEVGHKKNECLTSRQPRGRFGKTVGRGAGWHEGAQSLCEGGGGATGAGCRNPERFTGDFIGAEKAERVPTSVCRLRGCLGEVREHVEL